MEKAEIRRLNKNKRSEMSKAEADKKSSVIAELIVQSGLYRTANSIMLYMPLGNEVDTSEIMKSAFADGKRVILPVTDNENKIIPCYVSADTRFKTGRFSVKEPMDVQAADPGDIDLVIVPGVAFDSLGNRVGFGKGCYDGFLKAVKGTKVGICYDFQTQCQIPADPFDVKMNYIVTEKGLLQNKDNGYCKIRKPTL